MGGFVLPTEEDPRQRIPRALDIATGAPAAPPAVTTIPRAQPAAPVAAPQPSAAQQNLANVEARGSGISGIHNKPLRVMARVGDAILGTFAPRAERLVPGTEGNYAVQLARARQPVIEEQRAQREADESRLRNAQAAEQESLPGYHAKETELAQAKNELEEAKNTATAEHNAQETARKTEADKAKSSAALRKLGLDPEGKPIPYDELSESERGLSDLRGAQTEADKALADLRAAQKANEPQKAALAQARLNSALQAHDIALQRLGLSEKEYEARTHGTEGGVALPGALVADNGQPVGTAFQQNVRPTGTQRDAAGRATTMLELDSRIRKALQNPELQKGVGPLAGRLSEIQNRMGTLPRDLAELKNDLVSYGAFQAGMHPVRGIGALEYFDKVMGGLGQTPEELTGKLDSNKATAKSVKKVGQPRSTGSEAAGAGHEPTMDEINAEVERRKKAKGK